MNQIAVKQNDSFEDRWRFGPYILTIILVVLCVEAFFGPMLGSLKLRVFMAASIFTVGMLGLYKNFSVARQKIDKWQRLTEQTNLRCQVGGPFLGYPVYLEGTYRERFLVLKNNSDKGIYQLPRTRLELSVNNSAGVSLRVRGPYRLPEGEPEDDIVATMFRAAQLKQIGQNPRFFIRANSAHVTTRLFAVEMLHQKLQTLSQPVQVSLEKETLTFDHPGFLYNADDLRLLLELASDIAAAIEQSVATRQMLASI